MAGGDSDGCLVPDGGSVFALHFTPGGRTHAYADDPAHYNADDPGHHNVNAHDRGHHNHDPPGFR
ncbi:MAG TPA: hypothetical protein VK425_04125 [Acidimicrobiales bacterium]|nr:hypothetical protein [Acidimicrobiales bacterium]